MAKSKTRKYDVAAYLETEEDVAAYLQAALEDGDAAVIVHALGNIARARGMSQVARRTGLGRESLYKALSPEGNPEFATVLKVVRALGIELARNRRTPDTRGGGDGNIDVLTSVRIENQSLTLMCGTLMCAERQQRQFDDLQKK